MSENFNHGQCKEALGIKIQQLEKEISEIRKSITEYVSKDELTLRLKYLEDEIKSLREDSEILYSNNNTLQQTLTRLEELTKYLKESLELNQKNTQLLVEKVDKMYELMVTTLASKTQEKKEEIKNEIKVINDSNNNTMQSSKCEPAPSKTDTNKLFDYLKTNALIILFIVAFIIYMITGKWVLPGQ